MKKPDPTLKVGKLYFHEVRYRGKTRKLSVFEPVRLVKMSYNAMYGTDSNVSSKWTEYYEVLNYYRWLDSALRDRYSASVGVKDRKSMIRDQETIRLAQPLEPNLKYFFDKLFELKENLLEI